MYRPGEWHRNKVIVYVPDVCKVEGRWEALSDYVRLERQPQWFRDRIQPVIEREGHKLPFGRRPKGKLIVGVGGLGRGDELIVASVLDFGNSVKSCIETLRRLVGQDIIVNVADMYRGAPMMIHRENMEFVRTFLLARRKKLTAEIKSRSTKIGMQIAKREGKRIGGGAPIGYRYNKHGKLAPSNRERKWIKWMVAEVESGRSIRDVWRELRRRKIKTAAGKLWNIHRCQMAVKWGREHSSVTPS